MSSPAERIKVSLEEGRKHNLRSANGQLEELAVRLLSAGYRPVNQRISGWGEQGVEECFRSLIPCPIVHSARERAGIRYQVVCAVCSPGGDSGKEPAGGDRTS